ncbi:uncharacterized protein AMSG_11674 [Thecamonas trahens ATCC 50062]|uniref:Rho-GAP domain-containing protein n=1 Tax=Thecamonas trahens ATCC 50062 TaxID=461836 RepID=A0A0L0DTY1_THETB|nr:hypothetical protein AMSG_11674 [Thecamonas trahens ATCC 50062]KNC55652.1 hypothetical protein AMSG_11674 [Thecamonas trahens ATCC 50062]|eukprot:XP_013761480.1 hypothetical protein AMSG_11674 [Thecamonas trahens ATCC 50062]
MNKYVWTWAETQTPELEDIMRRVIELEDAVVDKLENMKKRREGLTQMLLDILEQEKVYDDVCKEHQSAISTTEKARKKLTKAQKKGVAVPEAQDEVRTAEAAQSRASKDEDDKQVEVKKFKNARLKTGYAVYCKQMAKLMHEAAQLFEDQREIIATIPDVQGCKNGEWILGDPVPSFVFGKSLASIYDREHCEIPYVLRSIVSYLDAKEAHLMEGIFRLSGATSEVDKLHELFDRGEEFELADECTDEYAAAALIKAWLRELPESLIPSSAYPSFMAALEKTTEDESVEVLRACVADLAPQRRAVLAFLLRYFHRVAKSFKSNKMSANNLAIVLGPNILRLPDLSPYEEMVAGQNVNDVTALLIKPAQAQAEAAAAAQAQAQAQAEAAAAAQAQAQAQAEAAAAAQRSELPESLIPSSAYPSFMAALEKTTEDESVDVLRACVADLAPQRRAVLAFLLRYFHRVAKSFKSNKMSANNLAIVLGPNILRLPDLSPYEEMVAGQNVNDVTALLIKRADVILGEDLGGDSSAGTKAEAEAAAAAQAEAEAAAAAQAQAQTEAAAAAQAQAQAEAAAAAQAQAQAEAAAAAQAQAEAEAEAAAAAQAQAEAAAAAQAQAQAQAEAAAAAQAQAQAQAEAAAAAQAQAQAEAAAAAQAQAQAEAAARAQSAEAVRAQAEAASAAAASAAAAALEMSDDEPPANDDATLDDLMSQLDDPDVASPAAAPPIASADINDALAELDSLGF